MASSLPKFQTLITVEAFRDLVRKHFEKELAEGKEFDIRDLERFHRVDQYAAMFIQHGQFGSEFDQERALRVFQAAMSWRNTQNVYGVSTNDFPAKLIDRRSIYFQNHDRYDHPLLHFVIRAFVKGEDESDVIKRFITYVFENHLREHPGEKIVMVFDMSEAGLRHLDYDLTKFIISLAQNYYPGILAYMLIYKMPFILSAAWRLIRTWLATEAEQFIKFVDAKSIQEYVAPDQLPTSMGGTIKEDA